MATRRAIAAALASGGLLAALVGGGAALGAKPDNQRFPIDDGFTFAAGDLCADSIDFHESGHLSFHVYFDKQGDLKAVNSLPSIKQTYSNPRTGLSVTDADIGLDRLTPTADGFRVLQTGIHFKIKGPDGRIVYRQIGLRILYLDADFNVIGQEVHGNFDPDEGSAPALCTSLGSTVP